VTDTPEYQEKTKKRFERKRGTAGRDECWPWTGATAGNGYGHTTYLGKDAYAHRVAAILYLDFDPSSGKVVMHLCDNPPCSNPAHLSIGTQAENVADSMAKGRRSGGKRLSADLVGEIKYHLSRGSSQLQLATHYGVSTTTIGQISRGQTWKDVCPAAPQEQPDSPKETERPEGDPS
jgi:hypothetical protein